MADYRECPECDGTGGVLVADSTATEKLRVALIKSWHSFKHHSLPGPQCDIERAMIGRALTYDEYLDADKILFAGRAAAYLNCPNCQGRGEYLSLGVPGQIFGDGDAWHKCDDCNGSGRKMMDDIKEESK